MDQKLQQFYNEFNDEVKQYMVNHEKTTINYAFKEVFLSYLAEHEVSTLADTNILEFKKESENIKMDGYSYNDYFHSLTILVSKFNPKQTPDMLWKKDIDKYVKKAVKFLKTCDTDVFEELEPTSDGYQAFEAIRAISREIENVNVVFITNDLAKNYVPDDMKYRQIPIKFDVYDIERLYHIILSGDTEYKPLVIRFKSKYKQTLKMIKVPCENSVYDCYVGVIPGELLANIYKDEGQDLIQKNVRSYLQATGKVNKGIKTSLAYEPEMFMAYNNGISTIAESIEIEDDKSDSLVVRIKEVTGWQIVNGGQTTASIYNALQNKLDLEQVYVQVKLSVIKDSEKSVDIAANISKYANSQNKINMSDFNANDEYHIKMEQISRRTFIPVERGKETEQWFYERARGQYMVELNRQPTATAKKNFKERIPKKRCVSKTVAAKCMMAYMGYPHYVSKGLETNFVIFSDMIKKGDIPEPSQHSYIDMIAKVILFQVCDKIVAGLNFGGYKAQINYYTIALVGKYCDKFLDVDYIWKNQMITPNLAQTIEELAMKVWTHFQNPLIKGINVTQWCKKEECWELLKSRYENDEL
ncbi:AIPR family protein [Schwartzia succinivorans]|jgi:hypothetical protein|uniref:AIPR protein n=1 Tax=Schwartzia succinivorans DSM 10502 TaxID=1123243 RepID=A0A1M4VD96_9FIRM|nr:AIPR family protein [Schwartzia succinivorans]SHE66893.1 AIPR protein [Schwartzia succinivorans DSM 10502]